MKVITSKNKRKLSNNKTPYHGYFIKINAQEIWLCATVSYKEDELYLWATDGMVKEESLVLEVLKEKGRGNRMVV